MREDMAERFSEPKGRYKKSKFPRRHKKVAKLDEDGQPPKFTSMRKVHLAVGDWYGDNGYGADYSILRRFLISHVGLPWDEVYSEICEVADSRTHDGYRLREAVDGVVCTSVEKDEEGNLFTKDRWGRMKLNFFGWWHEFYVNPDTGLLEYVPNCRNKYKADKYPKRVYEMDGQLYHQHAGIWYRVEMKNVPTVQYYRGGNGNWVYDHSACYTDAFRANEEKSTHPHYRAYHWTREEKLRKKYGLGPDGQAWYCYAKQSANSDEIKKLKKKLEAENDLQG
jgi:hypothetical protein